MTATNPPKLDGERLLQIARDTGLRHNLHGVSATDARVLISRYVEAVISAYTPAILDAVDGAIASGASGVHPPLAGHWLQRFWDIGRAQAKEHDQGDFTAWLEKQMPPGTIISDPTWWAPRIIRALKGTPAEPDDLEAGVTAIVTLMENGEWADILGSNPLLPRLWDAINDLYEKLDAAQGTPAAAAADAQPLIPGTPKRIWLNLDHDDRTPEHFDVLEEVSWCAHRQGPDDIEYVLAQSSGNPGPLAAVERNAELPIWWSAFVQNVCELPDRNSPNGEPEAMTATADELENAALAAIAASKEGAA